MKIYAPPLFINNNDSNSNIFVIMKQLHGYNWIKQTSNCDCFIDIKQRGLALWHNTVSHLNVIHMGNLGEAPGFSAGTTMSSAVNLQSAEKDERVFFSPSLFLSNSAMQIHEQLNEYIIF